jgi:pimeloyl-ACP methyl ester carboxylesterase
MDSGKEFISKTVISGDGTKIGYLEKGNGPGIILIHGGLMSAQNFTRLGNALSDQYTVYIPDRRGRGESGDFGDNYSLARECEDIRAIIDTTKSSNVFGLSSGAIIALKSTLTTPSISKVAIYEPPIPVKGANPVAWSERYEREVTQGKLASAFVSILKGTGDSYSIKMVPRFLLTFLFTLAFRKESKQTSESRISLKALIPTMHYDTLLVKEMDGKIDNFKDINANILLLGGNRSHKFLQISLNALELILPKAYRIDFKGIGHLAADNSGRPEQVATELKRFFGLGNQ